MKGGHMKKSNKKPDAFLPSRFVRIYHGKAYLFVRKGADAEGRGLWSVDGKKPVLLRQAMITLMGEDQAAHRSFVKFFKKAIDIAA
jgi:hypothetical protein